MMVAGMRSSGRTFEITSDTSSLCAVDDAAASNLLIPPADLRSLAGTARTVRNARREDKEEQGPLNFVLCENGRVWEQYLREIDPRHVARPKKAALVVDIDNDFG